MNSKFSFLLQASPRVFNYLAYSTGSSEIIRWNSTHTQITEKPQKEFHFIFKASITMINHQ